MLNRKPRGKTRGDLHSRATSAGMRRWYRTVPFCKHCHKVHLVAAFRRRLGVCAGCEARARRGTCPDCEARLEGVDFQNTDWYGVLVYARCPTCRLELVSFDGRHWEEAAEQPDAEEIEEAAYDGYECGALAGFFDAPYPEGDPRREVWERSFAWGEDMEQVEE